MRKILCLVLCLFLLCPCAVSGAEEPKCIALAVAQGPSDQTRRLLEGLARRDARATFFLWGSELANYPNLAEEILAGGHEIGIHGFRRGSFAQMSRRAIAGEFADTRKVLPRSCPVRLLYPMDSPCLVPVRQVAEVIGLAILEGPEDPARWARWDNGTAGGSLLRRLGDGNVLVLTAESRWDADSALATVDLLMERGFRLVTLSELANIRRIPIRPGVSYRHFPPPGEKTG